MRPWSIDAGPSRSPDPGGRWRRARPRLPACPLLPVVLLLGSVVLLQGIGPSPAAAQDQRETWEEFQERYARDMAEYEVWQHNRQLSNAIEANSWSEVVRLGRFREYPSGQLTVYDFTGVRSPEGSAPATGTRRAARRIDVRFDRVERATGRVVERVLLLRIDLDAQGNAEYSRTDFPGTSIGDDEYLSISIRPRGGDLAAGSDFTLSLQYRADPGAVPPAGGER